MTELSDRAIAHLTKTLLVPTFPERYQAVSVIGRGGMGVVWRAHDQLLDRDVAIKVLAERLEGESWEGHFAHEARLLAHLEHPGIVAVHDMGVLPDGRPWYAMRLVNGLTLSEVGATLNTPGEVVRLMIRLAETIAYAHARGVIHRDLTPRNVMVGPFGEVLVVDWGVALSNVTGKPPESGSAGTPGYMSPEQRAGMPADFRTDVYGLGTILRELLGHLPGQKPKALMAVVETAIADAASSRYQDVASLGADLQRYQDGLPVSTYQESFVDGAKRIVVQYQTPILLVLAYLTMRLGFLLLKGF